MATFAYVRVSTKDQHLDRQIEALQEYEIPEGNIFADRQSGKNFERPAYRKLMRKLKKGDLLIIKSIDRLGRNYDEILEQWRVITRVKEVDILVIDFPLLDTRKKPGNLTGVFISDLVLQILSYVAQTERDFMKQRQAEGIAAARKRGVHFGPKRKELPAGFELARKNYISGIMSVRQAASSCDMSYSTFYKRCREMED